MWLYKRDTFQSNKQCVHTLMELFEVERLIKQTEEELEDKKVRRSEKKHLPNPLKMRIETVILQGSI